MCDSWDIIQTYHDKPIHLSHLKNSNPNANILLADISTNTSNLNKKYCWRNNDLFIRNWIRINRKKIKSNKIAILEWDVLVSKCLPNIEINGLFAKNIKYPTVNSNWPWFKELNRLKDFEPYAAGIAPFAVIFMNQSCIDTWMDKEYDILYNSDIFCELRLPSIINSKNISILNFEMNSVKWNDTIYSESPDIYHPIKKEIYRTTP